MMRRFTTVSAVGLVVLVSSCDAPREPTSSTPQLHQVGVPLVCDFNKLKIDVTRYFGPADEPDVLDLVTAMKLAFGDGDFDGATDRGFDILSQVARVTGDGEQTGTAEQGSFLVNNAIACMTVGVTGTIDFTESLGPTGGFAVRGGGDDLADPVISFDAFSGVQPPANGWADWLGGRTLFFGRPLDDFMTSENLVGGAYDWSTVPARPGPLNGRGVVALCVANPTNERRVQESSALLPVVDVSAFLPCPDLLAAGSTSPVWNLASRLVRFGMDLATPTPLHAATARFAGGTGGLAGGFSPFAVVDPGEVAVATGGGLTQPSDAFVDEIISPPVEVRIAGAGGTGFSGVEVSVQVITNRGEPVEFSGQRTVLTDENGVASFDDLSINKPGGYRLLFTTENLALDGVSTQKSDLFHIKPLPRWRHNR